MDPINLQICQDCKLNPAVYGDGLTWSRCSECQLKATQAGQDNAPTQPTQQESIVPQEPQGQPHEIVAGMTSIIMPVYILNFGLFHYTGNAIGSIREHTNPADFELVVVDNGSPIKPPELTSYYANRVIQNQENFGVTKAWNQGIRMSVGEYIVLINNDVQVFEDWLPLMKEAIDKDGYDLVMAHPMYSNTEPFARAVEAKKIKEKVLASGNKYSTFKDFSCVMFKRSLIDEVGLFNEAFFVYNSDSDFLKRMEQKGKKYICIEAVATSHLSDATGLTMKEERQVIADKDRATYEELWTNKKNLPAGAEFVRLQDGGDPIYFLKDNQIHHVVDPDTLHALGGEFGMERTVTEEEFNKFQQKEDVSMDNYKDYI